MTRNDAYIILNLIPGIGPILVRQLISRLGSPEAILGASETDLSRQPGLGPKRAHAIARWEETVDLGGELELMARCGVEALSIDDEPYPALLKKIKDPPLIVYAKGRLAALSSAGPNGLAVVGSRKITNYGETMTRRLVNSASNAGWTIVSGLARGVDTIAHKMTLDAGGTTIAVTGGGLMSIYPRENDRLADEICRDGCLVSEQPMAVRPDRRTFPMRNRIIAGMTKATLVVEAGYGSGSLITAERAFEQKKMVFAVPGRADSPQSKGCNDLIRRGAKLTETLDDIQDAFTFLPGFEDAAVTAPSPHATRQQTEKPSVAAVVPELDDVEQRIMELLRAGEAGIDELVQQTGRPVHQLLSSLMGMELKRLIKQLPGKRFTLYGI